MQFLFQIILLLLWNSTIRESVVPQWTKIEKSATKIRVINVSICMFTSKLKIRNFFQKMLIFFWRYYTFFWILVQCVVKTCGYYDFSRRATKMKSKSPEAAWLVSGNCFDICMQILCKNSFVCVVILEFKF